jgi:hypothetical protein
MDDANAHRTLQIKIAGHHYPAAPLGQGQLVAIQMIRSLPPETVLSVISGVLENSLGETARNKLITQMASGTLELKDLVGALSSLAEATAEQRKNASAGGPPRTLDIAGRLPEHGTYDEVAASATGDPSREGK